MRQWKLKSFKNIKYQKATLTSNQATKLPSGTYTLNWDPKILWIETLWSLHRHNSIAGNVGCSAGSSANYQSNSKPEDDQVEAGFYGVANWEGMQLEDEIADGRWFLLELEPDAWILPRDREQINSGQVSFLSWIYASASSSHYICSLKSHVYNKSMNLCLKHN